MKATCDHCHKTTEHTMKSHKLNPTNWHPHQLRLCKHCRTRLGYQPVNTSRTYNEASSRTGGRPW
jgi:hypothetical protein